MTLFTREHEPTAALSGAPSFGLGTVPVVGRLTAVTTVPPSDISGNTICGVRSFLSLGSAGSTVVKVGLEGRWRYFGLEPTPPIGIPRARSTLYRRRHHLVLFVLRCEHFERSTPPHF